MRKIFIGYLDGTYRGHTTMTCYEFAAGIKAALERVQELYRVRLKTYHLDGRGALSWGQGERGFWGFCTDALIISD
ncbi:hypothetical protein FACHB389_34045 [Nostoc calcicola FACHB-389]|nr:hypothetical protein FACHB389_34045 [Nostoc calcicola FACHB-389]